MRFAFLPSNPTDPSRTTRILAPQYFRPRDHLTSLANSRFTSSMANSSGSNSPRQRSMSSWSGCLRLDMALR
jgi:hypothetical protein